MIDPVGWVSESSQVMNTDRIVGRTWLTWKTRRRVLVSTVYLPWAGDYDHASMPPYETMFSGDTHLMPIPVGAIDFENIGGRYDTRENAAIGHRAWCRLVSGVLVMARHTVSWQEMTTWQ